MRQRVRFTIIGFCLGLLGLGILALGRSLWMPQPILSPVSIDPDLTQLATQITVRILSESGAGSGVIWDRQDGVYTVLTCDHVLDLSDGGPIQVLTYPEQIYPAQRLQLPASVSDPLELEVDLDIGFLRFESQQEYPVVPHADPPPLGSPVLAAGFPNWHLVDPQTIEDTREWGTRALRLTKGQIQLYPPLSLPRGYQLGYTNAVEQGMSGGPILDTMGQLVGINGRLKFPPQGIEVFTFVDGSRPSPADHDQMRALSWGIPVGILSDRPLPSPL